MRKSVSTKLAVAIQILAIFMIQFNALAPHVARLFPAIAVGDLSECHCTMECRCTFESRKNGVCCCKQAKRLKLKMHCATTKSKMLSLRSCPCGGTSHISFVSPENQVYLGYFTPITFTGSRSDVRLDTEEPRQLRDRIPEPPDPPPHLFFLS